MHWKTEEMKQLARDAAGSIAGFEFNILTQEAGGDHDTTSVHIDLVNGNDAITVCGFNDEDCIADKDDADISMIEMRSFHSDSGGGIQTDSEELVLAAHRLTQKLKALGWIVVPNMRSYF